MHDACIFVSRLDITNIVNKKINYIILEIYIILFLFKSYILSEYVTSR